MHQELLTKLTTPIAYGHFCRVLKKEYSEVFVRAVARLGRCRVCHNIHSDLSEGLRPKAEIEAERKLHMEEVPLRLTIS